MKIDPKIPVAVFLGPSLPLSQAREILQANYYPPIKLGDLYKLLASDIESIVIIDGLFDASTPIWHREILATLDAGKNVYGASSMGALRACELAPYGMQGYGQIFEWYRDGVIDGDDEVALFHTNEDMGYQKISEPLVNIRHNLSRAASAGVLSREQCNYLVSFAKELYFGDRKFSVLISELGQQIDSTDELTVFLEEEYEDLKARDAMDLLRAIAQGQLVSSNCSKAREKIWYQREISYQGAMPDIELVHRAVITDSEKIIPNRDILASLVARWDSYSPVLRDATEFYYLRLCLADGILPEPGENDASLFNHWCEEQRIKDLQKWLQENGLQQKECEHEVQIRIAVSRGLIQNVATKQNEIDGVRRFLAGLSDLPGVWLTDIVDMDVFVELRAAKLIALAEWADNHGYDVPDEWISVSIPRWPYEFKSRDQANWLAKQNLSRYDFYRLYQQITTYTWMMAMGPAYFGFNWDPVIAIFRHLQIEGQIQELV